MMLQIAQSWAILLIVALGGLLSERSGVLNIGLEGMMVVGAFAATASTIAGASASVAGVVAGAAGVAVAAVFALFALRWRANPFIVGLALNLLAAGTVPLLSEILFGTRGSLRIGRESISAWATVLTAAIVLIVVQLFLYRTPTGVRLRIAGEEPQWLRSRGVGLRRYRLMGLVASGALAGVSGALLSLRVGVYLPNIAAGRGWIALVIVYLGYRTPFGLALAALFFGAVVAFSVRAQALLHVPPTLLLALPYLLTIVAFVGYAAFRRRRDVA